MTQPTERVPFQCRHLVTELATLNLAYLHLHQVGDDELLLLVQGCMADGGARSSLRT